MLLLRQIADIEAALSARLHQALRQQLVVGRHHGIGAHALLARAIAHRGQARASGQQARANALGEALGQLFGQGAVGGADQHGAAFSGCTDAYTSTVYVFVRLTVLEL